MQFRGKYGFLSNFHKLTNPITTGIDNELFSFNTVESAYQSAKSLLPSSRKKFEVKYTAGSSLGPKDAKEFGNNLRRLGRVRGDWEFIKLQLMYNLVLQKFFYNPDLFKMLLNTGNELLVEDNYFKDEYWGRCNGVGLNMLGKILMKVRDDARNHEAIIVKPWIDNSAAVLRFQLENIRAADKRKPEGFTAAEILSSENGNQSK